MSISRSVSRRWRYGLAALACFFVLPIERPNGNFRTDGIALAKSQNFPEAQRMYRAGDVAGAARALDDLVATGRLRGGELENGRKLLGLARFLLGDEERARQQFEQVLRANPRAQIDKQDLLDPGAGVLFEKIRGQVAGGKPSGRGTGGTGQRSPAVPERFTGIKVTANVKTATIFVDGLFVGAPGQDISVDPGHLEIMISAPGFDSVSRKVHLKEGQKLGIAVNLPKAGAAERAAAAKRAAEEAKRKQEEERRKEQERREQERREEAQRAADPALAGGGGVRGQPQAQGAKSKLDYTGELPRPKGYEGAQSGGAPPSNGQSLANDFYREVQPPTPPQPPAQPVYPPAYGVYPPAYGGGYQPYAPAPVPQPYYPPAPAYAPPVYQQPYGAPSYQDYGGGYNAPQNNRGKRERTASQRKEKSSFVAFLPFGAGQFQNEDYVKGSLRVLAEGTGLGVGIYFALEISAFQTEYNKNVQARSGDTAYQKNSAKYIEQLQLFQYYGFGLCGVSYVLGVIDSFINLEDAPGKRRVAQGLAQPGSGSSFSDSEGRFELGLRASGGREEGPGLGLGLRLRF